MQSKKSKDLNLKNYLQNFQKIANKNNRQIN